MDQLLGTFFELLKNMFLTWIASVDKKVEESRRFGVVVVVNLHNLIVFAPLPCTVYLVLLIQGILLLFRCKRGSCGHEAYLLLIYSHLETFVCS